MKEVIELFEKAKMFYIATTEKDQPRVRPFGGLLDYQGKMYFNTNCTKNVYKQLKKNPKVELCAFYQGTTIRVEALALEVASDEVKDAMLGAQPGVAKMYAGKEDIFVIFRLDNVVATIVSFGKETIVLKEI